MIASTVTPIQQSIRELAVNQAQMQLQATDILQELRNVMTNMQQQHEQVRETVVQQQRNTQELRQHAHNVETVMVGQQNQVRNLAQSLEVQEAQNTRQDEQINAQYHVIGSQHETAQAHQQELQAHRHELNSIAARREGREAEASETGRHGPVYMGQDERQLRQQNLSGTQRNATHRESAGDIPAEPPRRASCPEMFTAIQAAIRPPPKFSVESYPRWKEELDFWKEAHGGHQESALISEVALSANEPLRTLVVKFLRTTKTQPTLRTFVSLIQLLDKEFQRDSSERAVAKMHLFNNFQKTSMEGIREFWIRFQKMVDDLSYCGLPLSDDMVYVRALSALSLTESQRMAVLAATSQSSTPFSPKVLKEVSVRLLHQAGKPKEEMVCQAETDINDSYEEMDTWVAKGKGRNRPGMERAAIKGTSKSANYPNAAKGSYTKGKSKGKPVFSLRCGRCGSADHFTRDCHLPYQKILAFGTGKGAGTNSILHVAEETDPEGVWVEEVQTAQVPDRNVGSNDMEEDLNLMAEPVIGNVMVDNGSVNHAEDAWNMQWWDETIYITSNETLPTAENLTCHANSSIADEATSAIIDCGASWSVVGAEWLRKWAGFQTDEEWKCMAKPSWGRFRFGSLELFPSMGSIILNASVLDTDQQRHRFVITADIIMNKIPMLVSRMSLIKMAAVLDFRYQSLQINGTTALKTEVSQGGHMAIQLLPAKNPVIMQSVSREVYPVSHYPIIDVAISEESSAPALTDEEILRTHQQLGHATPITLERIFKLAKRRYSSQAILDSITRCGCKRLTDKIQRPLTNKHVAKYAGEVVFGDIFYPVNRNRNYPALILTDALTRFCSGALLESFCQESIIGCFTTHWIQWMGPPKKFIVDSGSQFHGDMWATLSNVLGFAVIVVPVGAHFSIGRAERRVQILEKSFQAICEAVDSTIDTSTKLAFSIMAYNMCPSAGASVSPMAALMGKESFLDSLTWTPLDKNPKGADAKDTFDWWSRLHAIQLAQAKILEFDAQRTLKLCIQRNAQVATDTILEEGDLVDIFVERIRRWQGTFRVIHDTGRSVLLENMGAIFKHPKAWVRLRVRTENTISPTGQDVREMTVDSSPLPLLAERPRESKEIGEASQKSKAKEKQKSKRADRAFDFSSVTTSEGHIKRGTTLARLQDTARRSTGRKEDLNTRRRQGNEPSSSSNVDSRTIPMGETSHAIVVEQTRASDLMGLEEPAKIDDEEEAMSIDLASIWLEYSAEKEEMKTGNFRFVNARNPYSPAQMIYTIMQPFGTPSYPDVDPAKCIADPSDFEGVDLSRIPPRKYLSREPSLAAIRMEIYSDFSQPDLDAKHRYPSLD